MFTSSARLPFDCGAMMNLRLSRVSPVTASGQGSSRCQARLRCSISASASPVKAEFRQQRVERSRDAARRGWSTAARPSARVPSTAGSCARQHRRTLRRRWRLPWPCHRFNFARHACAPIDAGAEHIEDQGLTKRCSFTADHVRCIACSDGGYIRVERTRQAITKIARPHGRLHRRAPLVVPRSA